jgi:predicted glycoside hydrolase/deacetylase ChbG (UPF0249 family)
MTRHLSRREFAALSAASAAGALFARPALAHERDLAVPPLAPPRLIVRGDDMGYSHSGNEAIMASSVRGIQTSIEIIAPSPWFPEAVRMLAAHPAVDVGVHLALTSEWDNVKWRPLTPAPSLRDADGYFLPMVFPNARYPGRSLRENPWRLDDIEREFRAQIELAKRHVPRISHLSSHMGCTDLGPDVKAMTRRLGREYGVNVWAEDHGVTAARYVGPHTTSAEKIESFLAMLDGLEAGKSYLFVDHPGLDTPELRAIHHIGYEQVAMDRQGVTDTFTSPRVRERVRARGIELIGYRDLAMAARDAPREGRARFRADAQCARSTRAAPGACHPADGEETTPCAATSRRWRTSSRRRPMMRSAPRRSSSSGSSAV